MAQQAGLPTPQRLYFIITGAIFATEAVIMGAFYQFPGLPVLYEAMLDAVVLTAVVSPLLFVYMYRPLVTYISELELANQKITDQSQHDLLTDLPNLVLLQDLLRQAIHLADREEKPLTLPLIKISRIKEINETLGSKISCPTGRKVCIVRHLTKRP